MSDDRGLLPRLKARGEEVFNQLTAQLMSNPQFVKAVQGAMRGKETLDRTVGRVLKNMNIPTRTEFKRALARIEALEGELSELRSRVATAARSRPRRRTRKRGSASA